MRTKRLIPLSMASIFLIIIITSVFTNRIHPTILVLYLVSSLVTFLWYAKDKSAAEKKVRRTPESTLHVLSLIGGWPGALIAQQTLRHKTKKISFRIVFWATVIMNCGVFVYLYTPEGARNLESLITSLK